jgi:cobalt-precorrin-5B (C1)-methyltransferase
MIKLAGGIMDTHSRTADARLDLLALHAALAGGGVLAGEILGAATVEAGLDILSRRQLLETAMASLLGRIDFYLRRRTGGALLAGAVLFSPGHGFLGATAGAEEILARWEGRND